VGIALQLARAATGGLATTGIAAGLGLSLNHDKDPVSTYVVVYAAAAVFALLCAGLWVLIERRKSHTDEGSARRRSGVVIADDSSDITVTRSRYYGGDSVADVRRSHDVRVEDSEAFATTQAAADESQSSPSRERRSNLWRELRRRIRRRDNRGR
jgi:FtsZ-interacting cell division protein ZipA